MGARIDDDGRDDEPTLTSSRPRFAPIPDDLLTDQRVSDGAVRMWGVLDRVAARDRLWPGRENLAARMGCSVDTIDRRVTELVAAGWMNRRRRGQGRTNVYTLHDRPQAAQGRSLEAASARPTEAAQTRRKREQGDREEELIARANDGGAASDLSPAVARPAEIADGRFDEWWALYPRKIGKAAARKAWRTATRSTDEAVIISGLRDQVPTFAARERRFVPHPATWLNRGGWEDEVEPIADGLSVLDLFDDDWIPRDPASNAPYAPERSESIVEAYEVPRPGDGVLGANEEVD